MIAASRFCHGPYSPQTFQVTILIVVSMSRPYDRGGMSSIFWLPPRPGRLAAGAVDDLTSESTPRADSSLGRIWMSRADRRTGGAPDAAPVPDRPAGRTYLTAATGRSPGGTRGLGRWIRAKADNGAGAHPKSVGPGGANRHHWCLTGA